MSWAKNAKEALARGETVMIKPRGHSMKGKVESGTVRFCGSIYRRHRAGAREWAGLSSSNQSRSGKPIPDRKQPRRYKRLGRTKGDLWDCHQDRGRRCLKA